VRKVTAWPENLVITIPQVRSEGVVTVSKASVPSLSDVKYVYDPETLKMMGAAFDTACHSFPPELKDHEGVRRRYSSFDTWIGESVMQRALGT
jgi:hypothetical protein